MDDKKHLAHRRKLVAWDHRAPDFPGFGGKVGLSQDVVQLDDGELLMVFHAGYWHMSPATPFVVHDEMLAVFVKNGFRGDHVAPQGGRIMALRSCDNRQSWSPPADVLVGDTDMGPQGISILPGGRLIVFVNNQASWYGLDQAPPGHMSCNSRTGVITSDDRGHTWSEPVWLDCPYRFYQRGFGNAVCLDDGGVLYATYASDTGTDGKLFGVIHRSDDHGKTWRVLSCVERSDGKNIDEPALVKMPSGRLMLLCRPDAAIFYSDDNGVTWDYSHMPPWNAAMPQRTADNIKAPRLLTLSNGAIVCVMTVYGVLGISWSCDQGRTWATHHDGRAFALDPDCYGYPGICELDDGSLLVVYYDATFKQRRTTVWAMRLRIDTQRDAFELLPTGGVAQNPASDSPRLSDDQIDVDIM